MVNKISLYIGSTVISLLGISHNRDKNLLHCENSRGYTVSMSRLGSLL